MVASNPTIGFDTGVENAVEAIRKLKTTAASHRRVMVVEMMGRTSGYLTLYSGFAAGADIILLPERDYDLNIVCNRVKEIMSTDKRYVIIAVSEACKEKGKKETISKVIKDSFEQKRFGGIAAKLSAQIEEITGYESRPMVLGHLQRGGDPCASDIILGSRLGDYAFNLLSDGRHGYIVGVNQNEIQKMPFPRERKPRLLDLENDDIYRTAKDTGICFGI